MLVLAATLFLCAPAWAKKSAPVKGLTATKAAEEFQDFSRDWIIKVNREHIKGITRMEILKQADGSYLARYHAVDPTTVEEIVKRTTHPQTPFVGTIKYKEKIYEARGKSIEAARKGDFKPIRSINIREIFARTSKGWQ